MVKEKCVACIGNFNGVHLGHQKLIEETVRIAGEKGISSRMITFTPDPSQFYSAGKKHQKILSDDQTKQYYAKEMGIDEIQFISFDKQMADTSAADFIESYLNDEIDTLVCGNDFTFGKGREGTIGFLNGYIKRNFDLMIIDDVNYYGSKVSTTRIIETIRKGKMKAAMRMLNHEYIVKVSISDGIMSSEFALPHEGKLFIRDCIYAFSESEGVYSTDCLLSLEDEPALVIYSF
ncbi:MAG: FAD synthetase family protein [Erysipelotrichaceae bacterium]|nr:FAD synthetase family protein [Erysipelotrichaceae bacterium]